MHLVIETGPLLAPVVAALAVAVWALAARAWGRPEWWEGTPEAACLVTATTRDATAGPRCTCPDNPFGRGVAALEEIDLACPAHGRG
jgi:hypothetical protein